MIVEYCLITMKTPQATITRIVTVCIVSILTLGIHYGWLVEPFFGHVHWLHAVHGRFCYIPIVIAAAWFGLRGGLIAAAALTILLLPYLFGVTGGTRTLAAEMGDIIFYFAIATLVGVLVEREFAARRKQQEAQLQLERSQKLSMVGQLAAGVAHEIKNPLASIKGAADILADGDASPGEREEFKGILRNEIKRIDGTVREFLEFARPKEPAMSEFDFSDSIQSTIRQMQAHAKRHGTSIEADIGENIRLVGDREKLHQMTMNLILNAIDASHDTGPVRLQLAYAPPHHVLVRVSDRGRGIDAADIDHVFDPFFTTRSSGTGLGLAIVKEIIDTHDGTIRINSTPGSGTDVEVRLPRSRRSA